MKEKWNFEKEKIERNNRKKPYIVESGNKLKHPGICSKNLIPLSNCLAFTKARNKLPTTTLDGFKLNF